MHSVQQNTSPSNSNKYLEIVYPTHDQRVSTYWPTISHLWWRHNHRGACTGLDLPTTRRFRLGNDCTREARFLSSVRWRGWNVCNCVRDWICLLKHCLSIAVKKNEKVVFYHRDVLIYSKSSIMRFIQKKTSRKMICFSLFRDILYIPLFFLNVYMLS